MTIFSLGTTPVIQVPLPVDNLTPALDNADPEILSYLDSNKEHLCNLINFFSSDESLYKDKSNHHLIKRLEIEKEFEQETEFSLRELITDTIIEVIRRVSGINDEKANGLVVVRVIKIETLMIDKLTLLILKIHMQKLGRYLHSSMLESKRPLFKIEKIIRLS